MDDIFLRYTPQVTEINGLKCKKKNQTIQIEHQWMTVKTIKIAGFAHGGKTNNSLLTLVVGSQSQGRILQPYQLYILIFQ